ncbi:tRNA-dihydrouridine synthase [Spirochaetia bacterium]|nr:tRNA-dihydrouridine synthase [Spirochaetia bacterium]
MAELSHRPLRELIEGFSKPGWALKSLGGCDEYFTEMISAGALIGGGPFESFYTDGGPCPEKLVYQLVGSQSENLAAAASLLDRLECKGIDINMGCSAPAITRTGAGVRWMADPDRAAAMIAQVRSATRHRLSVKLRIGMEDNFDYLVAFCRRLEAGGVDLITLHPRTGREKFKRRARWDYVGALRSVLGIPVAGNGDIAGPEDLVRRAASGCCDAVMVGRAAVRAPWLFTAARGQPLPPHDWSSELDLEDIGLRFLDLLAKYQPPEFHISRARRFFNYFCDNLKWGTYVKNLLNRETELCGIAGTWSAYFGEYPEERRLEIKLPGLF